MRTKLSIIGPEDFINDLCVDSDLEAKKETAPNVQAGGPAAEPFIVIVGMATIILAGFKVGEATVKLAGLARNWFSRDTGRQAFDLVLIKESGEVHRLRFERGMSDEQIRETLQDHIES